MPKLLYGLNGSTPTVRVMKDNADGMSTPNSDTGKFAFNVEAGNKIGFILDIIVVEPDFTTYPSSGGTPLSPNRYFLPGGSSKNTCEIMIASWNSGGASFQQWKFFPTYFQNKYGISYTPMVEVRAPTDYVNKKTFQGPSLDNTQLSGGSPGDVLSLAPNNLNAWFMVDDSGYNGGAGRNRPAVQVGLTTSGASIPQSRYLLAVFALPTDDSAIPDYSATPVAGQEVVRCDVAAGGMFRIALPGRTVADTDLNHFIMHENRIPAKILAAGDVAVAAGATEVITTRFTLPITTYMDYIVRRAGSTAVETFQYWHPPFIDSLNLNQECGFTYVVSGSTITITSTADMDIVIRYMICANAGNVFSSGGKKIQLVGNDGIGDYWQIKRPGSSDLAPTLDDIMLDSRVVYAPLLAEGFLNFNSTDMPDTMSAPKFKGERKRSLVIPNPNGLLLFPKVGAVYNQTSGDADYGEPLSVWNQHGVGVNAGGNSGKSTGHSTWANIIDETHLDVWSGGNNPWTYSSGALSYDNTIKGVRYYVFGIPPSL